MPLEDEDQRRREWRPADPRQAETYRRLRLFGDAPAAHFLDACHMMSRIELLATTHLVASSLRELDGGIRAVMSSMLNTEQRAAVEAADVKHKEEIEQISTLLGFDADEEIRTHWWTYASRLAKLTHRYSLRAPRPVDDEFREWWAQAQAVIDRIARQFETVYGEALPRIDALAAKEAPTRNDLRELREGVPHGEVALSRFFASATPDWFALLRDADYFINPPPLQPDEEGRVAYVPWPPGQYLIRMVGEDELRHDVVALARGLDTDNPGAQEAVVEIALALSAEIAAKLVEPIARFLDTPFQWRLPFRAADLIIHLARAGQTAAALALLRPLVVSSAQPGGGWLSSSLLGDIVAGLFPAVGIAGIALLADLLDEQLESFERTLRRDYTYSWRPTLELGRGRDSRDLLVTALRDAASSVVDADRAQLEPVLDLLEGRERSMFARLALDLLGRYPDDALVATRLGDRARFNDYNVEREYTLLARERFATLPDEVRERIFGWIEAGPDDVGEGDVAGAGDTGAEEAVRRRERWQLAELARLGDALPDRWREHYEALSALYGAPAERSARGATWIGTTAPLTKEELTALSVENVIKYLRSWTPEDRSGAASPEGLSRLLTEVVAEDPERFADAAAEFADVDPTYARAVISGLVKAASDGLPFAWPPVLALGRAAFDQPRFLPDRGDRWSGDLDPGWIGARLEVARLLSAGLEKREIPVELGDDVWALLADLAGDHQPDLDYEEERLGGMGPSGLSLSTVRGAAMRAVMRYARWRKEQTPEGQTPRLEPRLRELLDRHLDASFEPTKSVRSVYGLWFPVLVACDGDWAAARTATIFPLDGEHANLGRVAWEGYLRHNRISADAFVRLRPQYAAAIEQAIAEAGDVALAGGSAATPQDDEETRQALVGHLLGLYVQRQVELDDHLLGRFLAAAPIALRSQLMETIGVYLMNTSAVADETAERLRQLWERRLQAATAAGEHAEFRELRGFTWWFASAKLGDEWSLAQLGALLKAGGRVDLDHVAIERLVALRDSHLPAVVRCLSALIDITDPPWFVFGERDGMRTILRDGLQSDAEEVRQSARAAVNRLIARGHPEFEDLLR